MPKGASINPKDFSDSRFLKAVQQYKPPDKDDPKSRFSVSGFPTTLLNTMNYVLPGRLGTAWRNSHATIERFLFTLGIPLLDSDTQCCSVYGDMMAEAVSKNDYSKQAELKAHHFFYNIDSMCLLGGREIAGQGGTKIQCIARDTLLVKDISIRLAGASISSLVVLSIIYAFSVDDDYQIVPDGMVKICRKIVDDFKKQITDWQEGLRKL
jgi:hypothetical protein